MSLSDNRTRSPATIKSPANKMLANLDNQHDHALATGRRIQIAASPSHPDCRATTAAGLIRQRLWTL